MTLDPIDSLHGPKKTKKLAAPKYQCFSKRVAAVSGWLGRWNMRNNNNKTNNQIYNTVPLRQFLNTNYIKKI